MRPGEIINRAVYNLINRKPCEEVTGNIIDVGGVLLSRFDRSGRFRVRSTTELAVVRGGRYPDPMLESGAIRVMRDPSGKPIGYQ